MLFQLHVRSLLRVSISENVPIQIRTTPARPAIPRTSIENTQNQRTNIGAPATLPPPPSTISPSTLPFVIEKTWALLRTAVSCYVLGLRITLTIRLGQPAQTRQPYLTSGHARDNTLASRQQAPSESNRKNALAVAFARYLVSCWALLL